MIALVFEMYTPKSALPLVVIWCQRWGKSRGARCKGRAPCWAQGVFVGLGITVSYNTDKLIFGAGSRLQVFPSKS